jgi:hypothetical protein
MRQGGVFIMAFEQYSVSPVEAVGLIGMGAVLGGAAVRGYMNSLLHDEGHRVYVTPDFESLQAVIDVCGENGLEPSREIANEKVVQALMDDNSTVFLVNRPDVWEELGQPTAAPMLRVKKPGEAAERASALFKEKGFTGEVVSPLEDQDEGEIVFVLTDALSCGMIGFREHVIKMGKKPPKWSLGKPLGFATNE